MMDTVVAIIQGSVDMTITDRIDNITTIDPAHFGANIPAPHSVKIELTGRCNFACSFCARSMRLREQKDMDYELYCRLAKEMRQVGVQELGMFYLGESFLYPKLVDAIKYAKSECGYPYVFLTTNGSISYKDRVKACMLAGLDSLKFSFNYADEDQFESIARVKKSLYRKIFNNIRDAFSARNEVLKETGHKCGLYAGYIAYDDDQQYKMQIALREIEPYVDEIYALPLYSQATFVSELQKNVGYIPVAGNLGRLGNLRVPVPCWSCFTEGHISFDGYLSACCFDHDGRFRMGDLKTTSFMEAWNSQKFTKLRQAHLDKNLSGTVCEKCVAWS